MRSSSSWPRDLSGIFGTLVIDEAHTLRNRNTAQWTAAHAINAKFTILATATPIFNTTPAYPTSHLGPLDPKEPITTELNESPPSPAERLSGVNGLVCDITVNGTQMCGTCCASQIALRRHIRQSHPGAVENPSKANTGFEERVAGENALKLWISHESPIWRYADACEMSADKGFKDKFGDTFHRKVAASVPFTPKKTGILGNGGC
ncbi:hypothetical protein BO85DRAFT_488696 [Aspergillus piperis CBS 112811]|uniref:SNF2 N-terminal domain-containing protein n=1 Tax=Aspergillus piperis CBS 112811 TaxID=1448313 RepID=A0A8G1R2B3_9EURO|nr:hypothetical protein BO85DRAFT_488696 [Aspergillus piperis CBS 112811]RAH57207.1 hypothetical protein BO85DRAFT_488696 [Aspergillus piperis CBS 112811]